MDVQRTANAHDDGDDTDEIDFSGEERVPLALGYDPGQHPDPAALALVRMEQRAVPGKFNSRAYVPEHVTPKGFKTPAHYGAPVMETHYFLHFLEVIHQLPYPDQITYLAELLREPRFRHRTVTVRVDITGVGQHPCEALTRECQLHPLTRHIRVIPVRFVAGEKYTRGQHPESLGKGALVALLLQRLQWRCVHAAAAMVDLDALMAELEVFQRNMDEETGNTSYGALSGKHDDRVIALGLAVLSDVFADQVGYISWRR